MKKNKFFQSIAIFTVLSLTLTSSLQALSPAEKARQAVQTKLENLKANLRKMQNNLNEYGTCIFQPKKCTNPQKKNLRSTLTKSAAVIGTLIVALLAAAAAVALFKKKDQPELTVPLTQEQINFSFVMTVINQDKQSSTKMLAKGAYVDSRDPRGLTALSIAAAYKNFDMVEFLLDNRANPHWVDPTILENTSKEIKMLISNRTIKRLSQ